MTPNLIHRLSRRQKQALAVLADAIALPFALWCALALRLGDWSPPVTGFWPAFVVSALVCIPVFGGLGLYRQVIRYMGSHAMLAVVKGATVTALVILAVAYLVPLTGFPRSVPVIFWFLVMLYVGGTRYGVREYYRWLLTRGTNRAGIVIYGAGQRGVELVRLLRQQREVDPIAFVDDDLRMQRRSIDGLQVYPRNQLSVLLKRHRITQVLVALDDEDPELRRVVLEYLEPFEVRVRLIPNLSEVVSGALTLSSVRDVEITDVLGRAPVAAMPNLLKRAVRGKRILVTGAGGSIGSELSRQIIRQQPDALVLVDQSEFGLFQIHRELQKYAQEEGIETPVVAVLGSVTNSTLLARTIRRHRITSVYHAAAYKHVVLVENNVIQGIRNNTFGTLYAAQAAMDEGVEEFILISTDKAVRTTSVMGASKRLAEMVLQALQHQSDTTRFSMVRFGNVLGSSGSVVPLFAEQIAHGGPVLVTHPEVTRYFMTIPEAAQLVLQASSMAQGGDLFLLEMGKPVRIYDLAVRMIHLKGLTVRDEAHPDGDIEIRFSGLKQGEKMYEELLVSGDVTGTEHPKIMRAEESFVPWSELRGALNTLEQACEAYDYGAIKDFIEGLVEGADLKAQLGDLAPAAQVIALPRRGESADRPEQ